MMFAFIYGRMIESKEKERESCRCGFTIQYFFIKRLVSKEIVLLHRGQLYNQESAIRTWNVMVSVFFGKEDDQPEKMIMATKSAVENGKLYKCLPCDWFYTVRRKEARV